MPDPGAALQLVNLALRAAKDQGLWCLHFAALAGRLFAASADQDLVDCVLR